MSICYEALLTVGSLFGIQYYSSWPPSGLNVPLLLFSPFALDRKRPKSERAAVSPSLISKVSRGVLNTEKLSSCHVVLNLSLAKWAGKPWGVLACSEDLILSLGAGSVNFLIPIMD